MESRLREMEKWRNLPWSELIRRASESGPQFILGYLGMLRRHRLPPDRIRQYQERRVERIVRHALRYVPAYQTEHGAVTADIHGAGPRLLEQFPILDRRMVAERPEQFVAVNARRFAPKSRRTGGTTGKPLELYLDGRTRALWNMAVLCWMQWAGWKPGDRVVVFRLRYGYQPNSSEFYTPYLVDHSKRELFLNAARLDDRRLREFASLMIDFRPHLLRGLPSHLVLLARAVNALHGRVQLRAVLTGGELLGYDQRRYLEETFACKVLDHYNMWEMVAFAPQCREGSYHLIPELSYVEILRSGRRCEAGEVGEIVGTHLGNYSMPLVRYNMSDVASPIGVPCSCGRTTPTFALVGGRGRDIIVTPNGYVVLQNRLISAAISPPLPVEKLQFYQERKEEVLVRIVRGEGYTEDDTGRLIAEIDKMFDGAVKIRWEYVDDIPRMLSGKFPFVVSRVPLEL